jgi:hypothetical protein
MHKRLTSVLALALIAISASIAPAPADAHRLYTSSHAENEVYRKYNHLCGTVAWGWTWCLNRLVDLSSAPLGDHSWQVRYTWNEAKIGTTYGCGLVAQFYTHTQSISIIRGPSCAA